MRLGKEKTRTEINQLLYLEITRPKLVLIYIRTDLADLPNWPKCLGYLKKTSNWVSAEYAMEHCALVALNPMEQSTPHGTLTSVLLVLLKHCSLLQV